MEKSSLETQIFAQKLFSEENLSGSRTEELNRDLGFGTEVARRSRRRLLNRDGSFNVQREGAALFSSKGLYHYSLNISWLSFFFHSLLLYLSLNTLFALAYFFCGKEALLGARHEASLERLQDCFFFSVQTLATIGYGGLSPNGLIPNLLVTAEALVGLLVFAVLTGLFFARLSRPTAKIIFSQFAVIAPYQNGKSFQFRIANARANQLMHLEARVILSRFEMEGKDLKRKFYELPLERAKVIFFPLNWTIVHPIKEDSPLAKDNEESLRQSDAEFLVLLAGIDDTFSQQVYAASSYKHDELIWEARFVNILDELEDGTVSIDLKRLSEIERLKNPPAS